MTDSRTRLFKAVGIAVVGIACIIWVSVGSSNAKYSAITSFSDGPLGLSALVKVSEKLGIDSIEVLRKPLLEDDSLRHVNTFISLAPRAEISTREGKLLADFMKQGGTAIVSFHDADGLSNLSAVFSAARVSIDTQPDESFVNRSTRTVQADESAFPFRKGPAYEIYSRLLFKDCSDRTALKCVARSHKVGDGNLVVIVGIMPVVNALLGRSGNSDVAIQMLRYGGTTLIDEYHHFFLEKDFWDLAVEPTFALPIFGIVIAAILFLMFGRLNLEDAYGPREEEVRVLPYHAFNQRVLRGLVASPEALKDLPSAHGDYLLRAFPEFRSDILNALAASGTTLEKGRLLTRLHQRFVREK